jgi:hypothetical protein
MVSVVMAGYGGVDLHCAASSLFTASLASSNCLNLGPGFYDDTREETI